MIQKPVQRGKNHIGEEKKMYVPIRCFSCGKPIGHLWEEFQEKVLKVPEETRDTACEKFLDEKEVMRYCCRAALMTHIDLEDTARFKKF